MASLINKHSKIYQLLPFIGIGIILCYSLYSFIFGVYDYSLRHILALILFCVNIIVYIIDFRKGVLATGLLILLSLFNLVTLFPSIFNFYLSIDSVIRTSNPGIDPRVLLLLILFCICNFSLLFYIFFERKTDRLSKR